ncbi:MAG: PilZ domain-containing protein [Deltaproteobacteria bacterium]|nr:PilZ domain-containing protein [Deltaproteobacteria bacterium]
MASFENKRKYPRTVVEKKVHCYIEGARLDAITANISNGGMFLKTANIRDIPLDSLVGLVFRSSAAGQTTFLFGNVVRKQTLPIEGVGLKWEKAVTIGDRDQLARFLKDMFNIADPIISEEAGDAHRPPKRVFRFASLDRGTPGGLSAIGKGPSGVTAAERQRGLKVRPDDSDLKRVKVVHTEKTPPPTYRWVAPDYVPNGNTMPHGKARGVITSMIHRSEMRAPVSHKVFVTVQGHESELKMLNIGLDGMFIETPYVPSDLSAGVSVRFEIRTKRGPVPIVCQCHVTGVDDGSASGHAGMDLSIDKLDEGNNEGILKRYVKWLHFQSLSD